MWHILTILAQLLTAWCDSESAHTTGWFQAQQPPLAYYLYIPMQILIAHHLTIVCQAKQPLRSFIFPLEEPYSKISTVSGTIMHTHIRHQIKPLG